MEPNRVTAQLISAGMLCFLTACAANATPAVPAAPSSTAVSPTAVVPTNTATSIPPATQTPAASPTASGPFPAGSYRAAQALYSSSLVFAKDGTFTDPDAPAAGTYVVTGDMIVLNETKGECVGFPAQILWTFDGHTLTLKDVKDGCPHPRGVDLGRAWIKQP